MKTPMVVAAAVAALSMAAAGCATQAGDHAETDAPAARAKPDYRATGVIAKSLPEIAEALRLGEITAEGLTADYVARIEAIDRAGPRLQSVIAVNPDALKDARASDARRAAGKPLGPLEGVPILLKDNVESADNMATTAGALALKDNVTRRDSPLVAGLRAQGAIILGKTNLSQWANFRDDLSMSGWSALGGQVKNPHMLDRNPCGSSSGSGAAVAASLAAGAVGTETNGSISCPSTVNGVVGFKPTVGLVSQQYIVPISASQDTAGPMTKTVKGAAMMLNAMATGEARTDYVAALDAGALKGARIGVARFGQGSNPAIIALFNEALTTLEEAGAVLVDIDAFEPSARDFGKLSGDVLRFEFKDGINAYLAATPETVATRTLDELIAFNKANAAQELALFGQSIFETSAAMGDLKSPAYKKALAAIRRATREDGIDRLMREHGVVAIVSPSGPLAPRVDAINGDVWPEWVGAGGLAAIAGYPHLTVPMGAVKALPIGLSFIAGKDDDAKVLALGYAYEQRSQRRVAPGYLATQEADPAIAAAMARK